MTAASGRGTVWLGMVALALVAAGCGGDDHDASRAAIQALADGTSTIADAVPIVVDDGLDDETARALGAMLAGHLEPLADAVIAATEGGADAVPRPRLVSFFELITDDADARELVAESLVAWITLRIAGTLDATEDAGAATSLDGIDLVFGAVIDGVDQAGESAADFRGRVLLMATQRVARRVAEHEGIPVPAGEGIATMLDEAFGVAGNPLDLLALSVPQAADAWDADDDWRT
jgi:hypothetical protein